MKIAIVKLGAKGDVVRTLPILIGIKEKYPDSEITWITKKSSEEIIKTSPHINQILTIPINTEELSEFDLLYNFDIDEEATKLAEKIKAKTKLGFYSEQGFASAFNLPAEYYLNTLFDDETKISNRKTYQEMMFETAELDYKRQHHPIFLTNKDKEYARSFIENNNINTKKLIGIHLGSAPTWPSKAWHLENVKEFIIKAKNKDYEILLFAGPDDTEKHEKLTKELEDQEIKVYSNNPNNSDTEFASLVNICKFMVCSDSFALHISLALKIPTICLFFCTSPFEVEDYDILKKVVSPLIYDFFPEKMDQYDESLVKSISSEEVLKVIEELENLTI